MIIIDYSDRRPIYEQITDRFRQLIVREVLKPEEQLPSVRVLAMELSINPNTIQRAYQELERQGLIYSVKGKGSFVSPDRSYLKEQQAKLLQELSQCVDQALELHMTPDEILKYTEQLLKEGMSHD